jgi:uroporphyrin-III C-methyltransferase / precorrin-2 dehydrogenase / sirohydrochlorin ferrochelatase
MDFFPLFANVHDQPCLVVGGGEVATRKTRDLLAAGARVTVNSPECCPALLALLQTTGSRVCAGPFDPALVRNHLLVVAATSNRAVNQQVADAARADLRLCNVVDDGAASTFIVPAIVDRSPVIIAVSSGGRAPVLSRLLRQRLEEWLPARLGKLADWAGIWRERARRRFPDISSRRAFWEQVLAGPPAARFIRGDEPGAEALTTAIFASDYTPPPTGRAWLVGAGPGDPALISVRGLRILEQADVVLHDRLVAPELLRAARREAEIICVGKTGGGSSASQDDINRLLVTRVRAGHKVCRLKGGDPLIFGRGGEEALALAAAGLPFEIVPGITAASGCSATAGIPLTHRGLATAVTLVTAQGSPGGEEPDWQRLAALGQTLVIYMGGRRIEEIAGALVRCGRAAGTAATLIIDGTGPEEQVVTGTLENIAARSARCRRLSPGLLIVGETAALAAGFAARREAGARMLGGGDSAGGWPAAPAAVFG